MYCHNCGAQLPQGSYFCNVCGTKLIQADHASCRVSDYADSSLQSYAGDQYDYGVYDNSTKVTYTSVPMLPDGSPFERDEYLKVSLEYKKQKTNYQFIWVLWLFGNLIISVGIAGLIMLISNNIIISLYNDDHRKVMDITSWMNYPIILVGILLIILLNILAGKVTKKKVRAAGDACYQKYLSYFNNEQEASEESQAITDQPTSMKKQETESIIPDVNNSGKTSNTGG